MPTATEPPPTGFAARRGEGVYWSAAGEAMPGPRPGVVVADVTAAGAEFATDDPGTGFFCRALLAVPAGESRPIPGWPGWAIHCAGVFVPGDWFRDTCYCYLTHTPSEG
jgi:hypothetical protein